ncbi:hypothetical protein A2415_03895 [candidate division WWE3 bacterium RIFOXYC1_FULL_39_7]|uniref:Uncharacterized protein n=1 Tax=candidate division WWE3 bacterium RIFOXYC1_FULL_39_7 TaxID=1802643 RepID=A0A1F4WGR7_UNCKA|nr:MAG: hypothetical protein A2415_03895 [candidate division WWE3 bacterium RIFOXYC1_FULL_39_7]
MTPERTEKNPCLVCHEGYAARTRVEELAQKDPVTPILYEILPEYKNCVVRGACVNPNCSFKNEGTRPSLMPEKR